MPDRNERQTGKAKWTPRPPIQLGYRGKMLLIYGAAWVIIGLGVPGELPSADYQAHIFHLTLPDWFRVALWCSSGTIALATAFRPKGVGDALGWVALYLPPSVRAISFFAAWVDSLAPIGGAGYERGWVIAATYTVIVMSIYILSGWPEPPIEKHMAESERRHEIALYRNDLMARRTRKCPPPIEGKKGREGQSL